MHIAQFTNMYHPVISGVVRSVSTFRAALTELGHNVFVFAQNAGNYQDTEPFIFRYPTINITWPADFPATIPIWPFVDQLLPPLKLDVIHAHHPVLLGQAAANKAAELNLPLVFTFHTRYREYSHYFPLPQEAVQEFVKGAIDAWLGEFMQKCQHIVVPTESMRSTLVDDYEILDRVTVIPTGIDLRPFQQAEGDELRAKRGWTNLRILISVGRLAKEKNWRTLLDAVARAAKAHQDLRLVLIGAGPEGKALEKYTRKLGIADRVEFVGEVPFQEVPAYLRAADLFAFASVSETQGLVTLEAMAAGLPVVAVDATGTRDVLENDKEGLLTENSSSALAAAIGRVLSDSALAHRYQEAAQKKAQSYSVLRQSQKLVEVYHQAVEDKKANRFVVVGRPKKLFTLNPPELEPHPPWK